MIDFEIVRENLQRQAFELGFSLFGIAPAQRSPGFEKLVEWIARGYAGTMSYIPNREKAYEHPESVLEGCKSVVMLGLPYVEHPNTLSRKSVASTRSIECNSVDAAVLSNPLCQLGNYASGQVDYHDLLRDRLNQLCFGLETMVAGSRNRGVVDTAPLMERDFALLAGLGWIGKNTLLLNRTAGSYFFLAALLTDVPLDCDEPIVSDHCGSCTACLDACPTSAFVEPRLLDASRCVSYLTIEHRGVIDPELSEQMGPWIFGCDVCQIVCPWNRKREADVPMELRPFAMDAKQSPEHWLRLDEESFRRLYRKTPFWRTKLSGMQRNAMIVAANMRRHDLRPLIERFRTDGNQVLRETSRWSLMQLDTDPQPPLSPDSIP
jgi:epoxyqueuosine reductase